MALKRILVPVDFSPQQDALLAQAASLAKSNAAELVLLHSIVSPEISVVAIEPVYISAAVMERFKQDHTVAATRKLESLAEELKGKAPVSVVLKYSDPVDAILATADELACDLIVMGSLGAGLDRFLLGSVAEAVTRRAPCPVVVARQVDALSHFKNLVVGIDFSSYSATLVDLALEVAHPEAKIHLLHIWQPPHLDSAYLFGNAGHESLLDTLTSGLNEHVAALEDFASHLPDDSRYNLHVETGRPAKVLLETYDTLNADAIIVGAHDSDGIEHVLGTVADRVLRHAATTVLLTEKALQKRSG